MANQSVENVKGLFQNKTTKIVMLLTFGALAGAVLFANMTTSNQQSRPKDLAPTVGTPNAPSMVAVPGTSDNPLHNEQVRADNLAKAQQAQQTGESAVPRITQSGTDKDKDPFDLMAKKVGGAGNAADASVPTPAAVVAAHDAHKDVAQPVAAAAAPTPAPAAAMPAVKTAAQMASERDLASAMAGLLNSWSPARQEVEVVYTNAKPNAGMGGGLAPAAAQTSTPAVLATDGAASGATAANAKKVAIKAGSILHAVVITSVNSDEPGPVLAQITTGPYAGGRLIGKFEMPKDSDKLVLTFSTLTMQNAEKSYMLTAYAVDPETARTALASDVDHHYLSRYGLFAAATFASGYGQALTQEGTTQTATTGPGGVAVTTQYPTLDNRQIALSALGSMGGQLSNSLKEGIKRPPTVTLNSGTEIGVLVMQDASF